MELKSEIKDALNWSEAEYTWQPVYIDAQIDFDYRSIKRALGTDEFVDVYSAEDSRRFLDYSIADDDWEYVHYVDLLNKIDRDYNGEFRVVILGEEDSGARAIFIIVKSPRGQLIGLRSISVHT